MNKPPQSEGSTAPTKQSESGKKTLGGFSPARAFADRFLAAFQTLVPLILIPEKRDQEKSNLQVFPKKWVRTSKK
ncbi:MAG: hypothetical protein K6C40_08170 [Thermoguttaceae bacterium]|nr:hypothetical protein [Thermoguttaceae bacterium]